MDQLVEPPVDDFWPEDEPDFEEPDFDEPESPDEPDFVEPESEEEDDESDVDFDDESEPLLAGTVDEVPVRLSVR